MVSNIHSTAIVHENAKIGKGVKIGPYCTVGENVQLGDNVELISHVCVDGIISIGEGTTIFPFASIGLVPQDKKFEGEKSKTIIGKNNVIREHVTIQPGTSGDRMETVIGDNNLLMVGTHVAHDCVLENNIVMANNATLAGHVYVESFAIIGGLSAVHQFARIGAHSIIGGMSAVAGDVIPFGLVKGERAYLEGINLIGLKRRNFEKSEISNLMKAFKEIFSSEEGTLEERVESASSNFADSDVVGKVIKFLQKDTSSSLCLPK